LIAFSSSNPSSHPPSLHPDPPLAGEGIGGGAA
jgi:hypothetical protein